MPLPKVESPKFDLTVPSSSARIQYRPYLVKEEKILMMAMESDDTNQMIRAVKDVISSCVETDGFDVNELALFDLEYIFTQLRSKSVGESATVGVKCKECDVKNDVDVQLDKVYVDVPSTDKKTIKLTDTIGVTLKYPSVNATVVAQGDTNKSNVERIFDLIVACIDSIYTQDEVFDASEQSEQELKDFIESLNTKQFNKIREFVETIPSASIDVDFMCTSCGKNNSFNIKGLGNFFS